jgi:N-acetylmuramoyl-L-alanine amidase
MRLFRLFAAAVVCLLAGCVGTPTRSALADWAASSNHDLRRPTLIVIHHTSMDSAEAALAVLRESRGLRRVSAHYLIAADGRTWQLVSDHARAWHAGAGRWGGIDDLNSASIGIELDNDGREPFPDAQIDALLALLGDLVARHRIDPRQVVGHGDVAPTRKADPHAGFPWGRLAAAGYGWWPRAERVPAPAGFDPWLALAVVGYDLADRDAAVRAWRRHYRGDEAATLDADDHAILHDLVRQRFEPAPPGPWRAAPPRPAADAAVRNRTAPRARADAGPADAGASRREIPRDQ